MINKQLINLSSPASSGGGGGTGNQEEGLILHLDANDVDSYDGDGAEWVDITDHEYTPATNVSEHFNTVLWNGDGSTDRDITGVGFVPDLVWIKKRANDTKSHRLCDVVRGAGKILYSDLPNAQASPTNEINGFITDGFNIGNASSVNDGSANDTYVAWCFKAGGAPVTNTNGDIDSQVSANNDLGFSIVEYSGGNSSGTTVGHGLDVPPELIITKNISASSSWPVFVTGGIPMGSSTFTLQGSSQYLALNSNTGFIGYTLDKQFGGSANSGSSSQDIISYCFTSKRGVSKVGSYAGGAAGNKIYTGFEPAFVMFKNATTTGNWIIHDNKRDVNNPRAPHIRANTSGAEDTGANEQVDFNRDGFTLKGTGQNANSSGHEFIYYAVAKNTNETSLIPTKEDFTAGSVTTVGTGLELLANTYSGSGNWLCTNHPASHYGTITGANYVNDGIEDYFEFSSDSTYVDVATPYLLDSDFTIEMWQNLNAISGTAFKMLLGGDGYSSGTGIGHYIAGSEIKTWYSISGSAVNVLNSPTGTLVANKWQHVVLKREGSTWTHTVDGVLTATATGTTASISSAISRIGRHYNNTGYATPGKVAQVRIYGTALSQVQIKSNYDATAIYHASSLQLDLDAASFPQLGETGYSNTPTTWTDSTSNGYVATITGGEFDSELGNSIKFTPNSTKIVINQSGGGNSSALTNVNNFTVEMWVNFKDESSYNYIWANMHNSINQRQCYSYINPSNQIEFTIYYSNNSNSYRQLRTGDVGSKVYGKWTHMCWQLIDRAPSKIWIDGEEQSVSQVSGATNLMHLGSTANFQIGGGANLTTNCFSGLVGQTRMYHDVLTEAQIRQNYNFTKPNYPNGFDGTISGTSFVPAAGGEVDHFAFDGSNDSIDLDRSIGSSVWSNDWTASTWIKFDTTTPANQCIFTSHDLIYNYLITDNNTQVRYSNGSSCNISTPSGSIAANNWYHIVVTKSSTVGAVIYINGVSSGTSSNNGNSAASTGTGGKPALGIYNSNGTNNYDLDGKIAAHKFFNTALTGSEVLAQFNTEKSHYGL